WGPLAASTMGYEPQMEGTYAHDPARANALLDEAGWVDTDGDGVRDKDGQPLVLQAYLQGWGYLPEVGQLLQSQLHDVGMEMQMQTVAYPAAVEAASQGLHHLAPMVFSSSDPSVLNLIFPSSSEPGFNWSMTDDAELVGYLAEAMHTMDLNRRAELYSQAQIRIMDLALILQIRDYVNINAASSRVHGLQYDRRGWFPWLHDVYLEEP
ncbi:MAG: ABC transporter substrate-binding protein, partial [Candidatus Thermoplasmatota archaeon]|nr:ABC transporter substrate-binding protein [Candidatus Thermoplasmatota archaeon]